MAQDIWAKISCKPENRGGRICLRKTLEREEG